jgi:hypothetical protein
LETGRSRNYSRGFFLLDCEYGDTAAAASFVRTQSANGLSWSAKDRYLRESLGSFPTPSWQVVISICRGFATKFGGQRQFALRDARRKPRYPKQPPHSACRKKPELLSAPEILRGRRLSFQTEVALLPSAAVSHVRTRFQRASPDCDILDEPSGKADALFVSARRLH